MQVVRTFFATLNAFSHATVGSDATDGDLFGAYDAVQHYMKFICMPKLSTSHLGSVCHASNHGTQVGLVSMRHMVVLCLWSNTQVQLLLLVGFTHAHTSPFVSHLT